MRLLRKYVNSIHGFALKYIFFCYLVTNFSSLIEKGVSIDNALSQVSPGHFVVNSISLKPGDYYLSLGRPISTCVTYVDGKVSASSKSFKPATKSFLTFGWPFSVRPEGVNKLELICENGSLNSFFIQKPVVAAFGSGILLHFFRLFFDLALGVFSGLLLVFFSIGSILKLGVNTQRLVDFFLSLVVFNYCCSLSHIYRVVLPSDVATVVHVFSRCFFGVVTTVYFLRVTSAKVLTLSLSFLPLFAILAIACAGGGLSNVEAVDMAYVRNYWLFPIVSFFVSMVLILRPIHLERRESDLGLAIAWTFLQVTDWFKMMGGYGFFTGASFVSVFAYRKIASLIGDYFRGLRLQSTTQRMLASIESKRPLNEILTQLATIASGETHFTRVSAYIDGFCVGVTDSPKESFLRVMDSGYTKSTDKDEIVRIKDGRGSFMVEALVTQKLQLKIGSRDGAYFVIVPIGDQACINLSDDRPVSQYQAYESLDVLEQLLPSLRTLSDKMIAQGFRNGAAMERVRLRRGNGTFNVKIGAIFLDINGFSRLSELYGNAFAEFALNKFLPALSKYLAGEAVQEVSKGDELYLVVLSDLISESHTIESATLSALKKIYEFQVGAGAELCRENGYEPLKISVGASVGDVLLQCDPIKTRTIGRIINDANFLLSSAGKGRMLIDPSGFDVSEISGSLGESQTLLVKSRLLEAREFFPLRYRTKKVA